MCGRCDRRIEGLQHHRHTNVTTPSIHGFAGTGQATFPTERGLRRNGTIRVPYEKMASPERDEPRSQRKDGFAGTGQATFPTKKLIYWIGKKYRRARRLYQRSRYWRCRIFPFTRVYRTSNPPLCVVVVIGGLRGCNITVTPMSQPPQYTASPERDKPRSLRKDGFAGTGQATFPTNYNLRALSHQSSALFQDRAFEVGDGYLIKLKTGCSDYRIQIVGVTIFYDMETLKIRPQSANLGGDLVF